MSAPQLVAGQIVAGKYAVQALLQHGGLFATYHAMIAPHRQVALKLYDPTLKASSDLLALLRRNEAAINALPGNWVVHILETGEDPEAEFVFSATELCVNPSLAQLVELCPLAPPEALSMLRNLARVVDLAHSMKLAHLGLKPSNVFVGPAPAYEVRIVDFGMNVLRAGRGLGQHGGPWVGWIAPEQLSGPGGPAADVFSAALLAFFAMTGRSYWRSSHRGVVDLAAWEMEARGPRQPASARAAELGLSLPTSMDGAFARALADAPGERFASIGALVEALAAGLEGRAVPAAAAAKPADPSRASIRFGAPVGGRPMPPRAAGMKSRTLIGIPGPNNPFGSQAVDPSAFEATLVAPGPGATGPAGGPLPLVRQGPGPAPTPLGSTATAGPPPGMGQAPPGLGPAPGYGPPPAVGPGPSAGYGPPPVGGPGTSAGYGPAPATGPGPMPGFGPAMPAGGPGAMPGFGPAMPAGGPGPLPRAEGAPAKPFGPAVAPRPPLPSSPGRSPLPTGPDAAPRTGNQVSPPAFARTVALSSQSGETGQSIAERYAIGAAQPFSGTVMMQGSPLAGGPAQEPPPAAASPLANLVAEAASAAKDLVDTSAAAPLVEPPPAAQPSIPVPAPSARPRWLVPAILLGVIGVAAVVFAVLKLVGSKEPVAHPLRHEPARAAASASAEPEPAPPASAARQAPELEPAAAAPSESAAPAPSEIASAPPPESAAPAAKAQAEPPAPAQAGQAQPSQPVKKPAAGGGSPKKPCGKFLKRCN